MPTKSDTEWRSYLEQLKLNQKVNLNQPSEIDDCPIHWIKALKAASPRPVPSPYITELSNHHLAQVLSILGRPQLVQSQEQTVDREAARTEQN